MDSYSDQSINLDELIFQLPSFIKTQEDSITKEELAEMNKRVISLSNTLGQNFTLEQMESFRKLLMEIKKLQEQETRNAEGEKTKEEECLLQKEQVVAIWKKLKKESTSEQKKQIEQLLAEVGVPITKIRIGYFLNSSITEIFFSIKKYKIVLCSIIGAFIVSTACWVRDNIPTTYFESLDALSYLKIFHGYDTLSLDNVCFIDISNYHETVKKDIDKSSDGDIVITRRDKLIKLLQTINTTGYKFILLDLYFDQWTYSSNTDVYNQINKMKNIIVCTPLALEDSRFTSISAPNSYYVPRFASGHTHCRFFADKMKPSVPVRMYNSLHNNDSILVPEKKYWHSINILGDSLDIPLKLGFRNSPITYIPFIDDFIKDPKNIDCFFCDIMEPNKYIPKVKEGRIIIIGDMYRDDMHNTYAGNIPGPLLTYLQYLTLEKREEHVLLYWLLFVIYIGIIWGRLKLCLIEQNKDGHKEKNYKLRKPIAFIFGIFWGFITSFLGYSTILGAISCFFLKFNFAYSTFVPSLMFSIMEWALYSKKKYNVLT